MLKVFVIFFAWLVAMQTQLIFADAGEYMSQKDFLEQNLGANAHSEILWFDQALRDQLAEELKYLPASPRLRYWHKENKRAWIVEEIGRDKPITMGFIVEGNKIIKFEVLVFRESRGYEVRYPKFTQQLDGMMLNEQRQLTSTIDNITGATLSVNAVKKMARFVLYLDSYISQ